MQRSFDGTGYRRSLQSVTCHIRKTHISSASYPLTGASPMFRRRFDAVAFHDCREQGLLSSMYDFVPFVRDGIVLQHKEGSYTHGPNELSLLWKDLTCSRYLIETDMDGKPLEHQSIALRLSADEGLYTGDDPPVRFSDLQHCSLDHLMHKSSSGLNACCVSAGSRMRWLAWNWSLSVLSGIEGARQIS